MTDLHFTPFLKFVQWKVIIKESLRANNRLTDTMVRNYRPLTSWELEVMVKGESIPLTVHKGDSSYR